MADAVILEWYAPRLEVRVANSDAFIARVAAMLRDAARARTEAGTDFQGAPLHRPRDAGTEENPAGRPYVRTGQLLASLEAVQVGPDHYRLRFGGTRVEARKKTIERKKLRAGVTRFTEVERITPTGRVSRKFRFQTEIHERNGTVAAILERPGKGKHGGQRPPLVVLRTTEEELRGVVAAAEATLVVTFGQVGETRGGV